MVSSYTDPFRAAVTDAAGLGDISDVLWDCCADWYSREQFESEKKGERSAAVNEVARCVRTELKKSLAIVAAYNQEPDPIPHEEPALAIRDVSVVAQEQSEPFSVTLSDYEQDRAWAFAQEITTLADALYGYRIRRFREEDLGGQLVSAGDVEAWYRAPESRALVRELSCQAEAIARGLPTWSPDDAAYFILTDQPPPVHPLRGTFTRTRLARREQRGVITIDVEPWVSEKTVARLYGEVRARVLPRHDARPQGMAVWRFVESLHAAPQPTLRDVWRELAAGRPANVVGLREVWRRWLAAHPDLGSLTLADAFERWQEKHGGDPKRQYTHFRRALLSGIEHGSTITWPGYRMLSTSSKRGGA